MNYKELIIFLAVTICSINAHNQPVPQKRAIEVARNFYLSKCPEHLNDPENLKVADVVTKTSALRNLYYIINFKNGGYALISADERFFPVLAYDFEGIFNIDKVPANCQSWLDIYESQIIAAFRNNGPFYPGIPAIWKKFGNQPRIPGAIKEVLPLTTGIWAQDGYYNQMCPADPEGFNGHAPVGCVALAMAGLMYYYRFPETGEGTELYTPEYQSGVYGPQFVDFSTSTYQWESMTDVCLEPNDAIAQICYHAGVALQTEYTPQSSGANVNSVSSALSNHFHYLTDDYLPRSEVPVTHEWTTMLIDNLDKKQPVIYRSTTGWIGHVYLCDGYQDSTHFHFNWGWSGAHNGFYYIDNLTPGGIQLNSGQGAVFNIFPDTTQFQYPDFGFEFSVLTGRLGSFEDGSGTFSYLPETHHAWLIKPSGQETTKILLDFSMIDTENDKDIIKIYDGESEEYPLLASLSGNDFPVSFNCGGASLYVTFESDSINQGNGFHANYYGYQLPFCEGSQLLTEPKGLLKDGSRYHKYENDQDCEWVIAPFLSPEDSIAQISLYFYRFDLASGDTVFIYDGANHSASLLGKFANGYVPGRLVSGGNEILVNFKTDHENVAQGWELGWDYILPEYCNETVYYHSPEAMISDGSGNKNYVENTDCHFVIDVPDAENMNIRFLDFDLEVDYDYLKFYNPENPNIVLKKVSGHELPDAISFPFNKLDIHFHSDNRDNFSGWSLLYTTSGSSVPEMNGMINISPNPVADILKIKINKPVSGTCEYRIFRSDGVLVSATKITSAEQIIDLSRLPAGIYLLIIENGAEIYQRKLLKY